MSSPTVLNPTLYSALRTRFNDDVLISNHGEEMIYGYRRNPLKKRKTDFGKARRARKQDNDIDAQEMMVEHAGEYYRVNCPHCHDTRKRLYVNYRWGVRDERGNRNLWLVVCYNENCFKEAKDRWTLFDDLSDTYSNLKARRIPIRKGNTVSTTLENMELPGDCTPLQLLPDDHHACMYLAQRGYDPARLGKFYGVQYCDDSHMYLARDRIIAPVFCKGKLVGYQARCPFDVDWKKEKMIKWWTGPGTPRSRVFYNYDNARKYMSGVIVEGPGDVWGFGPMCHGVLGSTVTMQQCNLFTQAHKNGSGVLLLDPEEMNKKKVKQVIRYINGKLKHGFCGVQLPRGMDPGSAERGWARDFVKAEAAKQGVKLIWKRKKNV